VFEAVSKCYVLNVFPHLLCWYYIPDMVQLPAVYLQGVSQLLKQSGSF